VIFGLAKLAESRDPETGHHLERIAAYSTRLATAIRRHPKYRDQMSAGYVSSIGINSALHDIGKVGIPDIGFIAQELLEAQERCGVKVPNLVLEADPDRLEAAYGVLVPILTRAIQQLTEMLDCEKAERKRLEERVEALEQYVF
jgi:hypothetical protein